MLKEPTLKKSYIETPYTYPKLLASLGAIGTALQNYPAVALFIYEIVKNSIPASRWLDWSIHIAALGAGGLCSGMVNYWMNVELLNGFFERMTSNKDYQYKTLELTTWQQLQYFGGLFIFVVTGILFGLMAFAFSMEGPLAMLSVVAGIFVAGIMTIQEVETWLSSYDNQEAAMDSPLTNAQYLGKWVGHMIAAGNVLALSLLFTLSLAEGLIALHVAAQTALIIGVTVAFTFGAFTEFYFYNVYLSNFCMNLEANWARMLTASHAWFGLLCVSTNAFVNAALTFTGVELLAALLITANITLPPMLAVTAIAAVSAFFGGSASFILGLDFWVKQNPAKQPESPVIKNTVSIAKSRLGLFAANEDEMLLNDLNQSNIQAATFDHPRLNVL